MIYSDIVISPALDLLPEQPTALLPEQPTAQDPLPDYAAEFAKANPPPFTVFNWREFSQWQRDTYGAGFESSKGKSSIKHNGRYGNGTVPSTPRQPSPLRMDLTPKTFSTYSRAIVSPITTPDSLPEDAAK